MLAKQQSEFCPRCGADDWEFYQRKTTRQRACRRCRKDPEAQRAKNLWNLYKMTLADYENLHLFQGGRCAVCWQREWRRARGKTKRLAVHHSHETGGIIALCCTDCNLGMGRLRDDPVLLRRAAELMETHA